MKLKNVVVGTRIQAKRNTTGECGEVIHKGAVLEVTDVLRPNIYDPYRARVDAASLDGGCAWVNPEDFRKVKEVAVEPVIAPEQEHLPQTYMQVGDYILSSGRDPELEDGVPYKVTGFFANRHVTIALHTSVNKSWQEGYCVTMQDYSTVLREVKPDADTST